MNLPRIKSILRSYWDMLRFACATGYFPLTLTLSRREREQQAPGWCLAKGCWANSGTGVIERLWTIPPLPKGEGRGEGEPGVAHPTVRPVRARFENGWRARRNFARFTDRWLGMLAFAAAGLLIDLANAQVNVNLGNIPNGQSVTITFEVT